MMALGRSSSVAVLLVCSLSMAARAGCDSLPINIDAAQDGQLFYQQTSGRWTPLASGQRLDAAPRWVSFVYIAKERWGNERSGLVAIKSARYVLASEGVRRSGEKQVVLIRRAQGKFDNGKCGAVSLFGVKTVSATSYDEYHDSGRRVAEQATLEAFHVRYLGRGDACKTSNNTNTDRVFFDGRSNRSQFSFDPNVVQSGMYSQFWAALRISRAYASSENLVEQRVESRRYSTKGPAKAACIRFSISVGNSGAFLRVNDLESVDDAGARATERSWQLID